jgi:hypothetical protein
MAPDLSRIIASAGSEVKTSREKAKLSVRTDKPLQVNSRYLKEPVLAVKHSRYLREVHDG